MKKKDKDTPYNSTTTTTGFSTTLPQPWSAQCPHCNPKCAHGYPVTAPTTPYYWYTTPAYTYTTGGAGNWNGNFTWSGIKNY